MYHAGHTQEAARLLFMHATERESMISQSIFKAYDIRGVVGKTLDADTARGIGRAFGSEVRAQGGDAVVVARDGRLSGPELVGALADGLRAAGVDVVDVGTVPTPSAISRRACRSR